MNPPRSSHAVLFLTWGTQALPRIKASIASPAFPKADVFWITDILPADPPPGVTLIKAAYTLTSGNLAKTELL